MRPGISGQPVSAVVWVERDQLRANGYNPNHVAPTELRLLKRSILATGWTQPIVARRDGEIVDGFHRWTIAADPKVAALTGGLMPVAYVDDLAEVDQIAATIRHNRARGEHGIAPMAAIVRRLIETDGQPERWLIDELGMEDEEVMRLADRSGMPTRSGNEAFGNGWVPR